MLTQGGDNLCCGDVAVPVDRIHASKKPCKEEHQFGGLQVMVVVVDSLRTGLYFKDRHLVWHVQPLLKDLKLRHEPRYRTAITISQINIGKRRGVAGDALSGLTRAAFPVVGSKLPNKVAESRIATQGLWCTRQSALRLLQSVGFVAIVCQFHCF